MNTPQNAEPDRPDNPAPEEEQPPITDEDMVAEDEQPATDDDHAGAEDEQAEDGPTLIAPRLSAFGDASAGKDQRMPPWVRRAIFAWWGVLVGLWLVVFVARELSSLITQFVLALFLSFAMEPGVDWLDRRGIHRGLATGLVMVAVLAFFAAFFAAMGSLIASQIDELANDLPGYAESTRGWVEDQFGVELDEVSVVEQLQSGGQAQEFLTQAADQVVATGGQLVGLVFRLLTVLLFAYYLTSEGPKARRTLCSLLPPARQVEVLRMWELAINKTGAYLLSRLILGLISGVIHWVFFASIGLPSPAALGLWLGLVSQFVPVVGIFIAGIIPAFIALGIDPTKALWVVVFLTIYQQIENYYLQPRVTAHTLDMHPAVAFGAVIAGTSMFGVAGAFLALPVLATAQAFMSAYVSRHTLVSNRLIGVQTSEIAFDHLNPERKPGGDG